MKLIPLTLPEFVFLDGSAHETDILTNRAIFLHTISSTIFEVFEKADAFVFNEGVNTYEFEHMNVFGVMDIYVFAVHSTIASDEELAEIYTKAASWYRDYCNWADRNIIGE